MRHLKYFEHKEYNLEEVLYDMKANTYWVYYSYKQQKVIMKITNSDLNNKKYDVYSTVTKLFVTGLRYNNANFITAYEGAKIRKATEQEIKDYEIAEQANKYNL